MEPPECFLVFGIGGGVDLEHQNLPRVDRAQGDDGEDHRGGHVNRQGQGRGQGAHGNDGGVVVGKRSPQKRADLLHGKLLEEHRGEA